MAFPDDFPVNQQSPPMYKTLVPESPKIDKRIKAHKFPHYCAVDILCIIFAFFHYQNTEFSVPKISPIWINFTTLLSSKVTCNFTLSSQNQFVILNFQALQCHMTIKQELCHHLGTCAEKAEWLSGRSPVLQDRPDASEVCVILKALQGGAPCIE